LLLPQMPYSRSLMKTDPYTYRHVLWLCKFVDCEV